MVEKYGLHLYHTAIQGFSRLADLRCDSCRCRHLSVWHGLRLRWPGKHRYQGMSAIRRATCYSRSRVQSRIDPCRWIAGLKMLVRRWVRLLWQRFGKVPMANFSLWVI